MLWNFLDYPAAIIPAGRVNEKDSADDLGNARYGEEDEKNYKLCKYLSGRSHARADNSIRRRRTTDLHRCTFGCAACWHETRRRKSYQDCWYGRWNPEWQVGCTTSSQSHEICQLVSIYEYLVLLHGQNSNSKHLIHPVIRTRSSLKLQSREPINLILIHIRAMVRIKCDSRTRFEYAFRANIDVMSVIGLECVSRIQTSELRSVSKKYDFEDSNLTPDFPIARPQSAPLMCWITAEI